MTASERTRILLIEDDSGVAQGLRGGLERNGYEVTWKASGAEGVGFASANSPRLVILAQKNAFPGVHPTLKRASG